MSIASGYNGYDAGDCAIDLETWEIHFREALEKSPKMAEGLIRVLFYLLSAVEGGSEGLRQTKNSFKEGIEWAYTFTDVHRAALKLFLLYIEGHLTVPDEPMRLLNAAIARGVENARKSEQLKD